MFVAESCEATEGCRREPTQSVGCIQRQSGQGAHDEGIHRKIHSKVSIPLVAYMTQVYCPISDDNLVLEKARRLQRINDGHMTVYSLREQSDNFDLMPIRR